MIEVFFRTIGFTEWTALHGVSFIDHEIYGTFQKSNLKIRRYNPKNYDVINTTNSMGFRDREENFVNRDLRGIWLAGGSNSYGGYVTDDEPFSAQIEKFGYAGANLASESHFADSQAKVIRHLVAQGHKPRAIVLELTFNNALRDMRPFLNDFEQPINYSVSASAPTVAAKTARRRLFDKLSRTVESASPTWLGIKARLINNSAVYGWMKVGINNNPTLRELTLKLGLRANVNLVRNAPVQVMRQMADNPSDVLFNSTTEFIAKLQHWIGKNLGVPFGVVLIPNFRQLYPDRFKDFVEYYGYQDLNLDPALPLRRLKAKLNEAGVKTLDVTQALSSSAADGLMFPDDGHMNARGHEIVASALSDWLESSLGVYPRK